MSPEIISDHYQREFEVNKLILSEKVDQLCV